MDRRGDELRQLGVEQLPPELRDAELTAEQRLCGRRAQQYEHPRLDDLQLRLEPRATGGHLRPVRLLVDAALSPRLPLEVLDGVRHVRRLTVDAGCHERLVE